MLPGLAAPGSADAPAPLVDAGASVRAPIDAAFTLDGHAEGFAGSPTILWTGPPECAIAAPSQLVTSASCSTSGKKVFTLTGDDGAGTATDTVALAISSTTLRRVAAVSGFTAAGAAGNPASNPIVFTVPSGATLLTVTVTWGVPANDFDVTLTQGGETHVGNTTEPGQEVLVFPDPAVGSWRALVRPALVTSADTWRFRADVVVEDFDRPFPVLNAPGWAGAPGSDVQLVARASSGTGPLALAWEADAGSRRFDDGTTGFLGVTFEGGTRSVLVRVTDAEGFEVVERVTLREPGALTRPLTVVAVIDGSFSPYHYDFLASQHPWNLDADPSNDLDLAEHPRSYIAGYPEDATPLVLTLPTRPDTLVAPLRETADAAEWARMASTTSAAAAKLYWIPGTKVIGAIRAGPTEFQDVNGAHGSASASVAAGNIHGSCPECLFVLVSGATLEALTWAASQPWIDVVTNSYGRGSLVQTATLGATRDNIYLHSDIAATKAGSERGQVIVFSAGNGFLNAFDVPMFTYWSSEKGPDWMITVGAADPDTEQTFWGAGKPVDVSSIGSAYPSSGGTTAAGQGTHGGTSNAAPTTAGYFAKVLQRAREILGDDTPGHADGVVASGTPVPCGSAWTACPLADGVLTRRELQDLVFANVLPSPQAIPPGDVQTIPTQEHAYYYQGHGVISGRIHGQAHYDAEWGRMVDAAVGAVAPYPRPAGEDAWFVVDSKCRQKLWGAWNGGYYDGTEPSLDPAADPLAAAFDAWCTAAPAATLATVGAAMPVKV